MSRQLERLTVKEGTIDLLRQSDFVVLAVNLTPETTALISHKELSLMKPTGTLVNISRGAAKPSCEMLLLHRILLFCVLSQVTWWTRMR